MKKTYKQITFCENKKRISLLEKFKLHLNTYLNNLKHHYEGGLSENIKAKEEHKEINKLIDDACSYIDAIPSIVGIIDENNYLTRGLDICQQNLMDRSYFYESLVNMTERAIAIYKKDSRRAKERTYNPLFWIVLLIDSLVNLPFETLGRVGFNQKKIETSFAGKLLKYIFYVVYYLILAVVAHVFINFLIKEGYLSKS